MARSRTFELQPDGGKIEILLEATTVKQRRLGPDDQWTESVSSFSNHLEAREAFDQLEFVYGKKGRLLSKQDDAGPAQLSVTGATPGALEVTNDFLLEQGEQLLGPSLFALFRSGALPLTFEGQRLVAATIANVPMVTTRQFFSGRQVHHPEELTSALLARPVASTIERLLFVELSREDAERALPNELAAAVRAAVRSAIGPSLRVLEAGDFRRPGAGKPMLKEIARCERLEGLRLVFEEGFSWTKVATATLERLEVGQFANDAALAPLMRESFPRLHTLAIGASVSAVFPVIAKVIESAHAPQLRQLTISAHSTGGADELFERLLASAIFPQLRTFDFGPPLSEALLVRHRATLVRLGKLRVRLTGERQDPSLFAIPGLELY